MKEIKSRFERKKAFPIREGEKCVASSTYGVVDTREKAEFLVKQYSKMTWFFQNIIFTS